MLRECSPSSTCHTSCVTCHISCVTCHMLCVTCHISAVTCHTGFLKANFFAQPIFLFKSFAQTKWAEKQQKLEKMTQIGKTVVNCAFLRSKAQILRNVFKKIARPYGRTVSPFRNSVVTCNVFFLFNFFHLLFFSFLDQVVILVGGGSVFNRATPSSLLWNIFPHM